MKKILAIILPLLVFLNASAASFDSTKVAHQVEIRAAASFTKHFRHNLSLGISEEIRSQVYNSYESSAYFHKSYTTLEMSYMPVQYFGITAGYTLKIQNTNNPIGSAKYQKHWADPKEFIRHRGIVAIAGHYKTRYWTFSLRERLDIDGRMDSVNLQEKKQVELVLRHKIKVAYSIPGKPLKIYGAVELINTLNRSFTLVNQKLGTNYGQYLSDARVRVGVKWRTDKKNTFNFSYRFGYGLDYDVNITKKKQFVELYRVSNYEHVIGFAYEFDW